MGQKMFEFRKNGMNGTPAEREDFLEQIFHGVRFNARIAISAAPLLGKTPREMYDALFATTAKFAIEQEHETGYDDHQTEMYVEAHVKAHESLKEQYDREKLWEVGGLAPTLAPGASPPPADG